MCSCSVIGRRFVLCWLLVFLAAGTCVPVYESLPPPPEEIRVPAIWYGISTSPYQTEDPGHKPGEPQFFQTDWELLVERGRLSKAKGDGTWSYTEARRDIDALKWLGVTHYRFGVEWARVEPRTGEYNLHAVQHYVDLARDLRAEGIAPVVCLWHFSFPSWLADMDDASRHGWLHPLAAEHWSAYVRLMAEQLAPHVDIFAPQNEPEMQSMAAFMGGNFPPGLGAWPELFDRNVEEAAKAFIQAVDIIREACSERAGPERSPVRIMSIQAFNHWVGSPLDVSGETVQAIDLLSTKHLDIVQEYVDIIGFTYYGKLEMSLSGLLSWGRREGTAFSDTGAMIYPEGLTLLIARLAERFGKPLLVVENGIADAAEEKHADYLLLHVDAVQQAIDQGYEVLGYFHWTLMDNYEWSEGYGPRFGLHTVDPETHALLPKVSAHRYKEIIAERGGVYRPAE